MRLFLILSGLLGSVLFLIGFVYPLNLNERGDNFSFTRSSPPSINTEQYIFIDPDINRRIHNAASLVKFNNPLEPYDLMSNLNPNLINIPVQNIQTKSGIDVIDRVRNRLVSRLTYLTNQDQTDSNTHLICNPETLFDFYLRREVKPAWITEHGLNTYAEVFIKTLAEADREGLDPAIYHREDIRRLLEDVDDKSQKEPLDHENLVELELLLTDAFFLYGFHLSEGMVEPHSNNFDWHIKKSRKNLLGIYQVLLNNQRLDKLVDILQPRHPGYLRLKSALLKYKNIKNSDPWHKVPDGLKMQKGDSGERVAALRSRLIISGDLTDSKSSNPEYFDDFLEDGVKRFQARHGIKVDGVVGSKTLSELNVPVEDRIRQIKLNMERWRWLPQNLGERYVLVNTANFELDIIENDQTVKSSLAIVGKKDRPTPALSQKITYMELNPYWHIPRKIALNDVLPRIKKDPDFLTKKNIRIFENWKADAKEINPESIDWDTITEENFVYKLRQDPKGSNALGRIKFMFPNELSIYLHDTPARGLFNETERTFSSGCIRIQKPIELAAYLMTDHSEWTLEKITSSVNSKTTQIIPLPDPINIHILYWTAWVDKDGTVNFRDDIYGRDRQMSIVLNEKVNSPEVLQVKKSEKRLLSFRTLPKSNPSVDDISKIESWLVINSSDRY